MMDRDRFEQQLLELLFRTNVRVTAPHIAYQLRVPIAEASQRLDELVQQGTLELSSDDHGRLEYLFPYRPELATLPDPSPPPPLAALLPAPLQRSPRVAPSPGGILSEDLVPSNAGVAALLSFLLPGAGHLYLGRIAQGLAWTIFVLLGYCAYLVPGIILHVLCMTSAARQGSLRLSTALDR